MSNSTPNRNKYLTKSAGVILSLTVKAYHLPRRHNKYNNKRQFLSLDISSLTYALKNHGEFIPPCRTPLFTSNITNNTPNHRTQPVNLQCQLIKTFKT